MIGKWEHRTVSKSVVAGEAPITVDEWVNEIALGQCIIRAGNLCIDGAPKSRRQIAIYYVQRHNDIPNEEVRVLDDKPTFRNFLDAQDAAEEWVKTHNKHNTWQQAEFGTPINEAQVREIALRPRGEKTQHILELRKAVVDILDDDDLMAVLSVPQMVGKVSGVVGEKVTLVRFRHAVRALGTSIRKRQMEARAKSYVPLDAEIRRLLLLSPTKGFTNHVYPHLEANKDIKNGILACKERYYVVRKQLVREGRINGRGR